jgi:hypothetical protein
MLRRAAALLIVAFLTTLAARPVLQRADAATPAKSATTPSKTGSAASPAKPGTSAAKPLPSSAMLGSWDVLARVGPRKIRVFDFCDAYFSSDPEDRPRPDSAGRAQFLESMIRKDVMGMVALQSGIPLDFTARTALREHSENVLRNVLYQRLVIDSIQISEQDVVEVYEQFKWEFHLRHIQFDDRPTAEHVLRDLRSRRLTWQVAVRRYSKAEDVDKDGDMGWRGRMGVDPYMGFMVFSLKDGEFSDLVADPNGLHIVQVLERRPVKPPALEPMRRMIHDQIQGRLAGERARMIQQQQLKAYGVTYDEANIAWAAEQFQRPVSVTQDAGGPTLNIDPNVPEFTPEDRGRVLARHKGGTTTMGELVEGYSRLSPILRPALDTPEAIRIQIDAVILEPRMGEMAIELGLDKDSVAVHLIEKERERVLVERMYQDSILSKVRITEPMRKEFYEKNKPGFFTYPTMRFASILRHSRAGADSLAARLRAGTRAVDVLAADSLRGEKTGTIQSRAQNEHGPYQKVLLEEMRPGDIRVEGPDPKGDYVVLQALAYDPGRQLGYVEVFQIVDESVRNLEAERLLDQFVRRHAKKFPIESHPERVMRFELRSV